MSHHDGEDGGTPAHDADSVHDDLVILLDDDGNQVGTAPRATVHSQHTPRRMRVVLPGFSYRATDAGGIVEDELCPVVVARLSLPEELVELNPDPDEVEEVTWVGWQDMYGLARSMPALLSPWAVEQMLEFGPELPVVR